MKLYTRSRPELAESFAFGTWRDYEPLFDFWKKKKAVASSRHSCHRRWIRQTRDRPVSTSVCASSWVLWWKIRSTSRCIVRDPSSTSRAYAWAVSKWALSWTKRDTRQKPRLRWPKCHIFFSRKTKRVRQVQARETREWSLRKSKDRSRPTRPTEDLVGRSSLKGKAVG